MEYVIAPVPGTTCALPSFSPNVPLIPFGGSDADAGIASPPMRARPRATAGRTRPSVAVRTRVQSASKPVLWFFMVVLSANTFDPRAVLGAALRSSRARGLRARRRGGTDAGALAEASLERCRVRLALL